MKSSERGVFGSIAADPCLDSIDSAKGAKNSLGWESFCFAVNAPFTGAGLSENKTNTQTSLALHDPRSFHLSTGPICARSTLQSLHGFWTIACS